MAGNPNQLFKIQKQIRENAEDLRNYVEDLYEWEEAVEKKPKIQNKKNSEIKAPVRGEAEINIENQEEKQTQKENITKIKNKNLVRDANTVQDYYKAWDKFNVDEELQDLEKEEQLEKQKQLDKMNPYLQSKQVKAPARAKIQIKGGRGPLNSINSLRDKGNLYFKSTEYEKAIEQYTECIKLFSSSQITRDEQDLYVTIYSNRAMAYLKLFEYSKAEQDCNSALKMNPVHEKALYRRAMSRKKMKKFRDSIKDFEKAAEISPANKEIQKELKIVKSAYQQVRDKAKQHLLLPGKEEKYTQNLQVLDVENNEAFEGGKYFEELEELEELDKEDFENDIYEDDGSGSSISEKFEEKLLEEGKKGSNLDGLDGDEENEEENEENDVEIKPFGKLKKDADKIKYHDHDYNKEEQLKQQVVYDENDQKQVEQDENLQEEVQVGGKFNHLKNIESYHKHRQSSIPDVEEALKHDVHFVSEAVDIEVNEKKQYNPDEVPKIGIMADHEHDEYAFVNDIDGKVIKHDNQRSDKQKLLKKLSKSKEGKALEFKADIAIGKDLDIKFGGEEQLEEVNQHHQYSDKVRPKKSIINPDSLKNYKKILQEQEEDLQFVEKQNKFKKLVDVEGKVLSHHKDSQASSDSDSGSQSKSASAKKNKQIRRNKSISFGGEEIIQNKNERKGESSSKSKTPRRSILKNDFNDQITLLQREENFNSDKLKNIEGKIIKHHEKQETNQEENQDDEYSRNINRQHSIKFDESNISKGGEVIIIDENDVNPTKKYKSNLKPRRSILKTDDNSFRQKAYSEYQIKYNSDNEETSSDSEYDYDNDSEDQKHVQFQEIAKVDIIKEGEQIPSLRNSVQQGKGHKKNRNLNVKSILKPKGTWQKNRSKSMRVPSVKAFGINSQNSSDQKVQKGEKNEEQKEKEQEKQIQLEKQKREKLNKDLTDFSINKRILKEEQGDIQQAQQKVEEKLKQKQSEKKEKINIKTQIQFTQTWANFKRDQNKQYEYLSQVDPSDFKDLFKQGMDVRLIQDLFSCLNNNFEGDPQLCLDYIEQIPKVKRFEINRMSMLAKEKQTQKLIIFR
ncbi:hypothetical protein PPERSA_01890 [Pseudocohnilembus persalinus]|uniref:RNA polymerase II-associated protein 3 n=1 Tax=Pseudocohnilembus persalinus TaxID=266149 RepID=A0A0V0R3D6_PSEPJ|nr:hypothetical protein PPERSA_01890 [Pseudocohnilembus persalinus]|eukprot:KRX09003.1 hypothetical protein PPERSA_01890 [Pseudocohnilembus persalinus]